MDMHALLTDAAWFRLGIVALDILAVIAVVRLWGAIAAWGRAPFPLRSFSVPARVRRTHARPPRG